MVAFSHGSLQIDFYYISWPFKKHSAETSVFFNHKGNSLTFSTMQTKTMLYKSVSINFFCVKSNKTYKNRSISPQIIYETISFFYIDNHIISSHKKESCKRENSDDKAFEISKLSGYAKIGVGVSSTQKDINVGYHLFFVFWICDKKLT